MEEIRKYELYYGSRITKITESMGRVWLRGRRLRQRCTKDIVHFAGIALITADVISSADVDKPARRV